ncbi:ubiquinone biosynthesis protein COQ9, mitochondrial-like [Daphnia carinata]|uniref:ubiquinone biosynthesis protein COQ9, mitochondrial-like n=1 Tax=Daphnia carinata TaxID=120202 RepID=UPI00257FD6B8|nr:ubiquinone biosynthesis protein COQ9, mitochondrial-like [Daphnia carinata]
MAFAVHVRKEMASFLATRFLQNTRSLTRGVFFRWTPAVRSQSTDAFTDDSDAKETQRLKDEETEYETDIKSKILDAALGYVDISGWSKEALAQGAESLGYPSVTHGLFPKGGVELVHHFYQQANDRLSSELPSDIQEAHLDPLKAKDDLKILRLAVEKRLRMNTEHIYTGRWTEAMGLLAFPANAPSSLKLLANLVDEMWFHAGDTSVDFSWYTKRALLATVYKSTELSMIQDRSDDFKSTWDFLDRRIDEMDHLRDCPKKLEETAIVMKGFYQTALNVMGVPDKRKME